MDLEKQLKKKHFNIHAIKEINEKFHLNKTTTPQRHYGFQKCKFKNVQNYNNEKRKKEQRQGKTIVILLQESSEESRYGGLYNTTNTLIIGLII